jgi:hypothetical protein
LVVAAKVARATRNHVHVHVVDCTDGPTTRQLAASLPVSQSSVLTRLS